MATSTSATIGQLGEVVAEVQGVKSEISRIENLLKTFEGQIATHNKRVEEAINLQTQATATNAINQESVSKTIEGLRSAAAEYEVRVNTRFNLIENQLLLDTASLEGVALVPLEHMLMEILAVQTSLPPHPHCFISLCWGQEKPHE